MEHYEDPGRIHRYEYSASNDSLVDRFLLRHWWKLTIRLIPKTMPANLVSMIGNLGSWFAFLVLSGVLFGPVSVVSREKPWVFGLAALGILLYQTFDALDGIQARRTGLSGPLGEFIDHFFDSFNVFLLPLGFGLAFLDVPPALCVFLAYLSTMADWAELRRVKETNKIRFGKLSSEEAQVFIILFYLLVWATGYTTWALPLPGIGLSPVLLILCAFVPIGIYQSLDPLITFRFAWARDILAETLSLAPIALWTLVGETRLGRPALVLGCVLLGFSGSRFAGDLLRSRLLGLRAPRWYPDLAVLDLVLLLSLVLPGLPDWSRLGAAALGLAWVFFCLALQFARTLARVRSELGQGLFTLPTQKPADPAQP